jgi:hypothetical protein
MTRRPTLLHLHDEIMLLALRDREGTIAAGSMYAYAIGGAILAELLLAQRLAVEEGRKRLVDILSDKPTGEPLMDECLAKVAAAKRRAAPQTWVQRFAHLKQLRHRVARGLCERGILRADEDTVLLLFRRKIYPEIDPRPERNLIERLRKAIFTASRTVDPRTVVLLSLANSAGLLKVPFDRKKLRQRKERIERLTKGELMGRATKEAVQAAQSAAVIAATMPAIMAAATVSH